ncbi:Zinc/iron permease [Pyronema domesticum]|uniref:Similar to Zinc-regulated transporter 2 acc. no. Q12436 n=1 Tax=Pyronema omphalodes (strain CBS 100304) TaxID=1076935 RepID=U4LLT0_PYROM|nr:Zinc/iron permease [Pyronema domesticum]CCX32883.1 Similar to Zinc-regulated transporter 2; acc. no. Q12436 [Pyronema omphalodes CBS 100304]
MNCPTRDPEPTGNPNFNQSPPLLERSLVPRSSTVCGGGHLSEDEYNLGLHVMALFVVLAQSTFACAFPIIAKRFPRLRIPPSFLFFARHFGTGVLIATAFVHLLPTAFISLTDPCLPAVWNEKYPAMAGAIAMAATFAVIVVEMLFTKGICSGHYNQDDVNNVQLESGRIKHGKRISGSSTSSVQDVGEWVVGGGDVTGRGGRGNGNEAARTEAARGNGGASGNGGNGNTGSAVEEDEGIGGHGGVGRLGFGMAGRRRSRGHSIGLELQRFSTEMASPSPRRSNILEVLSDSEKEAEAEAMGMETSSPSPNKIAFNRRTNSLPPIELTEEQQHKRAMMQCFLLEMGILFHSLFIGMAISVTTGPAFLVLLIAICFHQTFEGLALGSRIAALKWSEGNLRPWFMALAYGMTTPMGQALGLATHTLYSPDSQTGLLVVGIMNAISSGLLLFAGLVELLAEDFLSDESWRVLVGSRRVWACIFVFAGAFGMALVGAWA